MQNIAVIDCLCGARLRADLKGFICPSCKKQLILFKGELREFEDAIIVEGKIPTYSECDGIGMFNTRKRKGNRFGEKM